MYNIKGDNSTKLYHEAMDDLLANGDDVRPRGKLVKELRPAAIEFTNPYNRVTFLGGRKINPFFQIAESLWILSGRSDVAWLTNFNKNMATFSDNGVNFNAPYGERIIRWGDNDYRGIVNGSFNQLHDVYRRLLHDKDTRQATIAIGNPSFDNYEYIVDNNGRDIACNLYITFKVRNDKLHMTVFNRSNDLHWGTFGANLCQFTTIQETLLSWLRNSGEEEYKNIEIGTYTQITDSLHIYMEDYGATATENVKKFYETNKNFGNPTFECKSEPRMNMNEEEFNKFCQVFWDMSYSFDTDKAEYITNTNTYFAEHGVELDEYWSFAVNSMLLYKFMKNNWYVEAMQVLDKMPSCQWKASMMFFFKKRFSEAKDITSPIFGGKNLEELYLEQVGRFKSVLVNEDEFEALELYLALD